MKDKKNISQKIIEFIKYHNAFTIGLILIFIFSGAVLASEEIRDVVLGQEIITQKGIDNSQILAADLDNFDFQLTIQNVQEDTKNYYVDYSFQILAIKDNLWQLVLDKQTITVSKRGLGERDLGLYITEELNEAVDRELAYLKDVQDIEKEKGQTNILQTTAYTGLIGLVLSSQTMELIGYEPVVKPSQPKVVSELQPELQPELEVDEPVCQFASNRPCGTEVGVCLIGVQVCENGEWGECLGSTGPSPELCDGVDNDCDGQIDENETCSNGGYYPSPVLESQPEPDVSFPPEPVTTATTTEPIIELEPELITVVTTTEPIIESQTTSTDKIATTTSQ